MSYSYFTLNRLRVLKSGQPVYDQRFHAGVNVIRGDNGAGKSTIADFIFYALGGEFDAWKTEAKSCDEVHAEVLTQSGVLTVRREIGARTTSPFVFFGSMEDAAKQGLDGWQLFPLYRTAGRESFSQILFRASGIPESKGDGESNLTAHQLLRLAYADQRTPAPRLFRFEQWDTHNTRQAVGNLICGLNIYEEYEIQLALRSLTKTFEAKQKQLSLRLAAIPPEEGAATIEAIEERLKTLDIESAQLRDEIATVDDRIESTETKSFLAARKKAVEDLNRLTSKARSVERSIQRLVLELSDLSSYMDFITDLSEKLPVASASSEIIGNLDFTHCPSCLTPLSSTTEADHCVVCGSERDPERERSKYLQIRMDLQIQLRESRQLQETKNQALANAEAEQRRIRKDHSLAIERFSEQFEISSSPRESFLAQRNNRIGSIEREAAYLARLYEIAIDVRQLSNEKAELQRQIDELSNREKALAASGDKRRRIALTAISNIARQLLAQDLPRQREFQNAQSVTLSFSDDAVMVDGLANFAESSNVILKNTAILSLFAAATFDKDFYHPRFLLMDNVEDKGMQVARSHRFQELIARVSSQATLSHQIIFTTSMINPVLESSQYVIGPNYKDGLHTLALAPQR